MLVLDLILQFDSSGNNPHYELMSKTESAIAAEEKMRRKEEDDEELELMFTGETSSENLFDLINYYPF